MVFTWAQALEVLEFARVGLLTEAEFLWARAPGNGVLRCAENGKWYAILMRVGRDKLRLPGEGEAEILVMKLAPPLVDTLLGREGFLPAYHMNKQNWVTALLDGTNTTEELCDLLRYSQALVASQGKKGKKQ